MFLSKHLRRIRVAEKVEVAALTTTPSKQYLKHMAKAQGNRLGRYPSPDCCKQSSASA